MRKEGREVNNWTAPEQRIGGRPDYETLPAVAAATATATTTAAVSAAAAVTTATSATARAFGTRFIHIERTPTEFPAVDSCDCVVAFRVIRHFDEREAAGLARIAVGDNVDAVN